MIHVKLIVMNVLIAANVHSVYLAMHSIMEAVVRIFALMEHIYKQITEIAVSHAFLIANNA